MKLAPYWLWPWCLLAFLLPFEELIPGAAFVGLQLGGLISGAVVTERIFALPGFGKLTLDAVFTRDYPVVQAVVLVITLGYILINLVVDVIYAYLDPRLQARYN